MSIKLFYDDSFKIDGSLWREHNYEPEFQPKLFRMPGLEWHIVFPSGKFMGPELAYVQGASSDDLMALMIWADAVRRDHGGPALIIPYLPGARQDRRRDGEALSAKRYAELLNFIGFERVVCFDPHSNVMPSHINNLIIVPCTDVAVHALTLAEGWNKPVGVIAPDAGANKRAWAVAQALKVPMYQAQKHRDMATGKLSGFACEPLPADGKLIVIDDICDGGGSFKGLATAIKVPKERLGLYVSHGIFSKGSYGDDGLHKYYGAIFTTDSHPGTSLDFSYDVEFMKILHRAMIFDFLTPGLK